MTNCQYNGPMPTLNVRLNRADANLVKQLRARGKSISDVVRGAIRAEVARERGEIALGSKALLAEMQRRFPTPSSGMGSRVVTTDRRQVQRFIREKLRSS